MHKGLTYDDVLLVPQYSDIESRSEVSLATELGRGVDLKLPIISSPMDTVSETDMAGTLGDLGGLSIIHRYNTIEEQAGMIASLGGEVLVGVAVGIAGDYIDRAIACVVDSGYDGEVFVNLHNIGFASQYLEPGQKIAQAVLIPVSYCEVDEVISDNLNEGSTRGDGALGSTGDR